MQQLITVSLDDQLIHDTDEAVKKSSFRNRTHLIEYLLQRFTYQKKIDKHKDLIFYITILLGFSLLTVLLILR